MFKLEINTDNAAFGDGQTYRELSRILLDLADKIQDHEDHQSTNFTLLDINGNKVGKAFYVEGGI